MTNFSEKVRSVNYKNLLVNSAPKSKWYHFHRLSNLELKLCIKDKNLMNFLQLMTFNAQKVAWFCCMKHLQIKIKTKSNIKSVKNWRKCQLSFSILLKLYESGTTSILVPNWQGHFCYWLTKSFPENSSSRVTLKIRYLN